MIVNSKQARDLSRRIRASATLVISREQALTAAVLLLAFVSLAVVLFLLRQSRHGFDFSDEGSYLNDIATPWLYPNTLSQYGSVYHPIFLLLGEDVVLLRQTNLILSYVLAVSLAYLQFASDTPSSWRQVMENFGLALAMGVSVFAIPFWLLTPNYNSLVIQGLLVCACGLAYLGRHRKGPVDPGAIVVGIGGAFTFLGKPSSAVGLGAVVLLVLAFAQRRRRRTIAVATVSAFVAVSAAAVAIDGDLIIFVYRILNALADADTFHSAYTIGTLFSWRALLLSPAQWVAFNNTILATLAVCGVLWWLPFRISTVVLLAFTIAASASIAYELHTGRCEAFCHLGKLNSSDVGIEFLAFPVALGTIVFVLMAGLRMTSIHYRYAIALMGLLMLLPLVSALGTGNKLWTQASYGTVFWAVAPIAVIRNFSSQRRAQLLYLAFASAMLLLTVLIVSRSMEHPYRQSTPLRLQNEQVRIGRAGSSLLLLDSGSARYLRELIATARNAGFQPRTPMLDMTGGHPGTIFALGAHAVGLSWMIGGYANSNIYVARMLDLVPCEELARAWVLTAVDGSRPLESVVLARQGLDLQNFSRVHEIASPLFDRLHILWKPVDAWPLRAERCLEARRAGND